MFILCITIMSSSKPQSREPLTTRQRSILMAFYNENPYPSSSERHLLVQLTGRTVKQVQDWFSNRRVIASLLSHFHDKTIFPYSVTILDWPQRHQQPMSHHLKW
jgi:hypothetical protein